MILGLVSAKGAPGVTTAGLALVAVSDGILVEFDPSGGSIECWTAVPSEPGLVRAASSLRHAIDEPAVLTGVRDVPAGVRVVHAPTSSTSAESMIGAIGDRLGLAMTDADPLVVLDAGRWARTQPTASRIRECDLVAIVCPPTVNGVEAARALVDPILAVTSKRAALLLIGNDGYGPTEISTAVGVPVLGVLPWDTRAVNLLLTKGNVRGWSRTSIGRAAKAMTTMLTAAYSPPDREVAG